MPTTRLVVEVETANAQEALKALGEAAETSGSKVVKATDTTAKTMQRLENNFNRLAGQLDPVIKKQQELARAETILEEARKAGLVTLEEQNRLLGLAEDRALDPPVVVHHGEVVEVELQRLATAWRTMLTPSWTASRDSFR